MDKTQKKNLSQSIEHNIEKKLYPKAKIKGDLIKKKDAFV